jgi:hypothetical protein
MAGKKKDQKITKKTNDFAGPGVEGVKGQAAAEPKVIKGEDVLN